MNSHVLRPIFYLFFFLSLTVNGQEVTGVKSLSLGGISSTHGAAWNNNPAALGGIERSIISTYCSNSWFIPQLTGSALALTYKGKKASAGFFYHYTGFSVLRRQNAGLGLGRQFGEKLSLGMRFTYSSYAITGYGSAHVISAQAGLINRLSKALVLAVLVQNIGSRKNILYEANPIRLRVGLRYDASPGLKLFAEADQQLSRPLNIRGALEYEGNKTLVLRGGFSTSPKSIAFGIGLRLRSLQLDMSSTYFQYLGFGPGIGLTYEL